MTAPGIRRSHPPAVRVLRRLAGLREASLLLVLVVIVGLIKHFLFGPAHKKR